MTTIKLKNGSGAPTAGDLVQGEPALDLTNKRLYTEDSGGTVIEVGTNPTSVTTGDITATGTATFAGLTTTADVSFGDNDKAIFGAGSDLQIYHDGSSSYIVDNGTGNLQIDASDFRVRKPDGSEAMIHANADGAVKLFYDGGATPKLATTSSGIDVTGTIVGDGLTVDVADQVIINHSGDGGGIRIDSTNSTNTGSLRFGDDLDNYIGAVEYNHSTNTLSLYADNATRVAVDSSGIDVTGTVTADGLTVDGGTTFNQGSGDSVNIFRSTDYATLKIGANATDHFYLQEFGSNDLYLARVNSSVGAYSTKFASNGDISFYDTAGTDAKFHWDASAESLGIGTTSPSAPLAIGSVTGDTYAVFDNGTKARLTFNGDASAAKIFATTTGFANYEDLELRADNYLFKTGTTERMRIDSNGNVGINTVPTRLSSNAHTLNIKAGVASKGGALLLESSDESLRSYFYPTSTGTQIGTLTNHDLLLMTNTTEAMRIDSSGNLLVGTTNTDPAGTSNNVVGTAIGSSGYLSMTRDGNTVAFFNRKSDDGTVVQFRKDGSVVGSIGTLSGDLTIGTGDTGLGFLDGGNFIQPHNMTTNAVRDAAVDLGTTSGRFKDLYLSGGVYLGGTGSANYLDDYEEGSFTPVIQGATTAGTFTYGTQSGLYTKIGNAVSFHIAINVTATSTSASGAVTIQGLPFAVSGSFQSLAVGWVQGITFADQLNAYAPNSESFVVLRNSVSAATGNQIAGSDLNTTFWIFVSGTYRA